MGGLQLAPPSLAASLAKGAGLHPHCARKTAALLLAVGFVFAFRVRLAPGDRYPDSSEISKGLLQRSEQRKLMEGTTQDAGAGACNASPQCFRIALLAVCLAAAVPAQCERCDQRPESAQ
jgi:hypothetical protein